MARLACEDWAMAAEAAGCAAEAGKSSGGRGWDSGPMASATSSSISQASLMRSSKSMLLSADVQRNRDGATGSGSGHVAVCKPAIMPSRTDSNCFKR